MNKAVSEAILKKVTFIELILTESNKKVEKFVFSRFLRNPININIKPLCGTITADNYVPIRVRIYK